MDGTRMLFAYSSVNGSTAEIARSIALTFSRTGMDVDVVPVAGVQGVRLYQAVVLGSAVYGGKWRAEAVEFLDRLAKDLLDRDVWLFQSGPLGHSAQSIFRALPVNVSMRAECLRVKSVATFGGKLDQNQGGPMGHFLARAGFACDYRDFAEIRLWAEEIARVTATQSAFVRSGGARLVRAGSSR